MMSLLQGSIYLYMTSHTQLSGHIYKDSKLLFHLFTPIAHNMHCTCTFPKIHVFVHLSSNTESSLNLHNLNTALDTLPEEEWFYFGWRLNVSNSKLYEIRSQYSSDDERKLSFLKTYLTSHPAPSWQHVAEALYRAGGVGQVYHTVLERVQKMFPTGKKMCAILTYCPIREYECVLLYI